MTAIDETMTTGGAPAEDALPRRRSRRATRVAGATATAGLVAVLLVLSAVVLGAGLGYRPLIIRSGSMTPTIGVGAVVVSRSVSPLSVHPGEIVTFRDPALDEQLVTHRVVSMTEMGGAVHFVTKGDANRTTEHWSVPVTGSIGREVVIVPDVGRWLAALNTSLAHLVEFLVSFLLVAYLLLRWIWAPVEPSRTPAHLARGSRAASL